jgi:hypothetical protein
MICDRCRRRVNEDGNWQRFNINGVEITLGEGCVVEFFEWFEGYVLRWLAGEQRK